VTELDIVAFLTHCLGEDEAYARELGAHGDHDAILLQLMGGPASEVGVSFALSLSTGRFLKNLGPARVLADIAAKREILEWHTGWHQCADSVEEQRECVTVRLLAALYADRPGYNPAWTVE
jgi:hypothetical protein